MRDDLFSKESRLACPVHVPWCPRRESHSHSPSFEVGASADWATRALRGSAPGRICTDTGRGLSPLPLRWATGANAWRSSAAKNGPRSAHCMAAGAAKWSRQECVARQRPPANAERSLHRRRSANFACNLRVRSAVLYTLSYASVVEMVRRGGAAPPASAMSVRRSAIDLPACDAARSARR